MATEEFQSPKNPKRLSKRPVSVEDGEARDIVMSPGFRSVAAMAGWDEEALLFASLVVEDTPERESKHKKRVNLQSKTPPTNSRRKRRTQRTSTSPVSSPIVVLNLDDDETEAKDNDTKKTEPKIEALKEKKKEDEKREASPTQTSAALPCMDKLKEELSCAICLEICFEPSTTPCGHSFCKKCLKSAADKCGKRCPKCRQLIGNGRSCTVNTILWNTIQLLFPQEVEARKVAAGAMKRREEVKSQSPEMENSTGRTRSSARISSMVVNREMRMNSVRSRRSVLPSQAEDVALAFRSRRSVPPSLAEDAALAFRSRRSTPNQAEDAALAFRLQREEFMEAFRGSDGQVGTGGEPPISSARANIRALVSRANIHIRTRHV